MARGLVVGDLHATPREISDCASLGELICDTVQKYNLDFVLLTGDLNHTHDTTSVRVMAFLKHLFSKIKEIKDVRIILLVGNHDQPGVGIEDKHALLAYPEAEVIDSPQEIYPDIWAVPYTSDKEKFVSWIPERCKALFCHQTFDGSVFENGFFAPDGIDLELVKHIPMCVGGHIHKGQTIGNVVYVGSPRWRTASDANQDKYIYVFDTNKVKFVKKIDTSTHCKKKWIFEEKEGEEPPETYPEGDVLVKIYGSKKYIKTRVLELKAKGIKTKAFPNKDRKQRLSEGDGIEIAFSKFLQKFEPSNGSDKKMLEKMFHERIGS